MASSDLDAAYEAVVAWWRSLGSVDRDAYLRETFPIRFSYNSGKIENDAITLHDTEEIFEHGRVVSYTGDLRTLFEIENLKNAWGKALRYVADWHELDASVLLDFHRVLTAGTYDERRWARGERPGAFKRNDYMVADGVGYPPEEAPDAVAALLAEIDEVLAAPQLGSPVRRGLVTSSYAHTKIVDIHPFADGNGRCARLLQNICLMRCGQPPIVFDEKDRMAYYGALDAFHQEGDLGSFIEFCMVQSIKTWGKSAR